MVRLGLVKNNDCKAQLRQNGHSEAKKIAFITTDTYRIAAIEQLKTYAELLQCTA
ncbi:hypothetical protein ACEQPO_13180 [Bacillus sp. SL00103]